MATSNASPRLSVQDRPRLRSSITTEGSLVSADPAYCAELVRLHDFRFARAWWEPGHSQSEARWRLWNKGGGFSPYYRDIDLIIDWDSERSTYCGYLGTIYRPDVRPANLDYFFDRDSHGVIEAIVFASKRLPRRHGYQHARQRLVRRRGASAFRPWLTK